MSEAFVCISDGPFVNGSLAFLAMYCRSGIKEKDADLDLHRPDLSTS